ncbi:hypothetical protein KY290_025955 [Solanum tuberosum]|uniref:Uncharacterized protein n=1 Tax=Solanum tuberosum TaxID=4113 RepID=A0ABQ7UV16_SOLTU|nr:hypothetical protein KY289_025034 [Solanum tuberosum]KAH0755685.1 hypothetical protein KY290_025955 [Solanum tuberosum]
MNDLKVHFETTGPEIWEDTQGNVDIFVMGIESGGTIYGIDPAESNVLNSGKPGPHEITGNGVGFKLDILDMDVMEEVLMVSSEESVNMARELALKEGLMTIHPRFRERYLSSVMYEDLRKEAQNMQPISVD